MTPQETPMPSHFRTAILALVLAGGTLAAYVAAYAVMGTAPATASTRGELVSRTAAPPSGQTDISLREACATHATAEARNQCVHDLAAPARAVRIIDFASADATVVVR